VSVILKSNDNCEDLILLLPHYLSTYFPPQLKHLSYCEEKMDILLSEVRVLTYQPFQLFPCGNYLYICVRQDFASALQMIKLLIDEFPLCYKKHCRFSSVTNRTSRKLLSEIPSYIMTVSCYGFGLGFLYIGLIPSFHVSKCFQLSSLFNLLYSDLVIMFMV